MPKSHDQKRRNRQRRQHATKYNLATTVRGSALPTGLHPLLAALRPNPHETARRVRSEARAKTWGAYAAALHSEAAVRAVLNDLGRNWRSFETAGRYDRIEIVRAAALKISSGAVPAPIAV